jgi:hypothetical protein
MHNVTKEVLLLVVRLGTPEATIVVVTLRCKSHGNVILVLWQARDGQFFIVVHDVETSLSHVCILSGVLDSMVVVPFLSVSFRAP